MRGWIRGGTTLAAVALMVTGVLLSVPTAQTAAQSAPDATDATEVIEVTDLVYGSATNQWGNRRALRLDLMLPPDSGTVRPAVVLAHGGGFRRGSRKDRRVRRVALALAQRGYVTASITYRLQPTRRSRSGSTLQLIRSRAARSAQHDLQAAVRFLRRRANRYGIDRARIAALGSSAGGIAALRAAFNPEDPGHSGSPGYRSDLTAVVSLWGASDPRFIDPDAPPALMFHGRADTTVSFRLAYRTCRATRRHGNACRGRWWSREGHAAWHRTDEIVETTLAFLARRLDADTRA